jgi:hypothetical protein
VIDQQPNTQADLNTVLQRCGWLTATTGAVWLLLAGPAYWTGGTDGLEGISFAALLCLVPGWLVFFLGWRYVVANTQAFVALLGTVLRLGFVIVGMVAVESFRPNLEFWNFRIWLVVFYFATLWTETWLLVRRPSVE